LTLARIIPGSFALEAICNWASAKLRRWNSVGGSRHAMTVFDAAFEPRELLAALGRRIR
jgi:hypothetical protein